MSLAMYASPINDMNDTLLPEQQQNQQQRRSRTQRNRNEKVNSVIKTLRNLPPINHYDDNTNNLGDFTPMEPPKSIGATKTQEKENNNNNNNNDDNDSNPPVIPMFQRDGFQGYSNQENTDNNNILSSDVAIKKLNYVISLLEEQQDSKTSNIAEEVVLYFFLGIFIIFIVDSFVKVGKYIR
jgi:hypothetical protein